ncbi:hypothetical protein BEP19_16500 [Ammoniphilus oxalaticus]|uniref:Uncharacterized protein n=1 Tax=Ammoniphilus oxalaticus TaxID=66863 RepID=A0A419SQP3_9BACL|nr:hypothetical protein [Ammoniphilus oxalaticus]RKD26796.1 hypothetical protein BEP19_16500 [Ammoniphilus oxalaticus]
MSELLHIFQMTSKPYLTGEEQQRFWRRVHRYMLQKKRWWRQSMDRIGIDLIYEGTNPYNVYMTLPQHLINHFPQYPRAKERRSRGNWSYPTVDLTALAVPAHLSVCELKLNFDQMFSLPSSDVIFPDHLLLEEGERARVSFTLVPVEKQLNRKNHHVFHTKMENGFRPYRQASHWFIVFINWLRRIVFKRELGEQGQPFLSRETLRKLNDSHFSVKIRVAAEQRVLPKLTLPFTELKGENELKIQFLAKSEQKSSLREMNRLKTGGRHLSDQNLLGGRELSYLFSFLSEQEQPSEKIARSHF